MADIVDLSSLDAREAVQMILDMHRSPEAIGARAAQADALDDTRTWVDPNGYRLSDRLWSQRQGIRSAIDERLRLGFSRGEDVISIARDLERYLHPAYQPTRTASGRIKRDKRKGTYTATPRGGTGSYPARRLARTEMTRANGVVTDAAASGLSLPIQWLLSNRHPKRDICDDNAERSSQGYPPGVYRVEECPPYPPHPQCICTKAVYDDRSEDDIVAYLRGKYDLPPEGIGQAAASPPGMTVDRLEAMEANGTRYVKTADVFDGDVSDRVTADIASWTSEGAPLSAVRANAAQSEAFDTFVADVRRAGFGGDLSKYAHRINPAGDVLITGQDDVRLSQVMKFVRGEIETVDQPPIVFRYAGRVYIQNGNHRLVAARAAGKRQMDVIMLDLDAIP